MNAPTEADLDPRQSFQPGRLWSLWEMYQLDAKAFVTAAHTLERIRMIVFNRQVSDPESSAANLPQAVSVDVLKSIAELRGCLTALEATMTDTQAARLEGQLKGTITYNLFAKGIDDLHSRLRDEIGGRLVLVVNPKNAGLYSSKEPLFGVDVQNNFSSTSYDIEEAGNCMALERWTAVVTHLMRALQPSLKALEMDVEATNPQINWHNIIQQIEAAIKKMGEGKHTRAATSEEMEWYSDAATHFRYLKDAWRNYAAHGSDTYDEERARRIYDNVRGFMMTLAQRLKETP